MKNTSSKISGSTLDICPLQREIKLTNLYNKKSEYLGSISYNEQHKKYQLIKLDSKQHMSKKCLNEAFDLTEDYWKKETVLMELLQEYNNKNKG